MIERLLEAERARTSGELDLAAALLNQVIDADPRNAIAVVGLARVALDLGDLAAAELHAQHALVIDPDEVAARRILDEVQRSGAPQSPMAPRDQPADVEPQAARPAPARRPSWLRRLFARLFRR